MRGVACCEQEDPFALRRPIRINVPGIKHGLDIGRLLSAIQEVQPVDGTFVLLGASRALGEQVLDLPNIRLVAMIA